MEPRFATAAAQTRPTVCAAARTASASARRTSPPTGRTSRPASLIYKVRLKTNKVLSQFLGLKKIPIFPNKNAKDCDLLTFPVLFILDTKHFKKTS